ncbi:class I SAM-dependent methyltransferase [Billgrantia montanilacus]|uniref:Methyltransferase domain-containing protein n=1 Tax=Billgrantia montanilacus TaxID=2282305 RepID=A0A368U1L2_9GAMM|nr:class I SAM-dependent methyltransferase [Halomonas montanilacus]RCV90914.1 methyltransferase domain-containing protein [Halomonas montanilacus]
MNEVERRDRKKTLYRQCRFPVLQNRVYDSMEEAQQCLKGDIEIVEDQVTGLIYNDAFRPELVVYDASYNNEQGVSWHFRQHLEQVATLIEETLGKEKLVEVGCGKGFFLEMLLQRGVDVTGFDSVYDGDNPRIVKSYFEPGIIAKPAKGLILRHVLEHVSNPVDFLFQLKKANGGQGLIYIEVPCFEWICERRAWFDIFYEHVNYFRLIDFNRIFGSIVKSGRFFGQQYLYVVADLSSLREPVIGESIDFPTDFTFYAHPAEQNRIEQNRTEHPTCVWGGGSKGVIFSLLRERAGRPVDIVIDVNPEKQGKYLPGTGLLVQSPEVAIKNLPPGAAIYVMNSNYLEEIKRMSNYNFRYIGVDQ